MEITEQNFFVSSMGMFEACEIPSGEPDFISYGKKKTMSLYYYIGDELIRVSDHWGRVARCFWVLPTTDISGHCELGEMTAGKIKFSDLQDHGTGKNVRKKIRRRFKEQLMLENKCVHGSC